MSEKKRDYENLKPGQYMDDCIHLHACRRIQKIGKSKHLLVPRYCDELCEAYERSGDTEIMVTIEDAIRYARDEAHMIREGYDSYDTFLESELSQLYGTECVRRY